MFMMDRRSLERNILTPWMRADLIVFWYVVFILMFYAGVDMECHILGWGQPVPGGLKRVSVSVLEGKRRTEGG